MKNLFLLLFSLSLFVTVAGKPPLRGNLSGIVTDSETGKPLAGVSVFISDTRNGTSTNAAGEYMIANIPEGNHLVEFSHVGYSTIAEKITIDNDVKINIALIPAVVENNAVIITGVSRASQLKKVPFRVDVVRKEELQQTVASNIIESITRKAGVSSIATGPAISKPVIRGLGYNRVLTMNDGVRQEGQQWGDEHGIEIDEASVNKIEILKGPASLVYGSDAMGGVVNIITNLPVSRNTIKANIASNYQTNSRLRSISGNVAGNINGINWNAYITEKAAADYRNKYDGYVFNSKFNEHNAGGYAGYNGNWGFSHLLVSNFDLTTGLIEGERDTDGNFIKLLPGGSEATPTRRDHLSVDPMIPYQHIRHFKIATDNNFKLGSNSLTLNIAQQRNRREEFGDADAPATRSLFFDLKTTTYASRFHFSERRGFQTSIGVNGMYQSNTNRGAEQLIPDYILSDAGVFLFTEKDINSLTLSGGIRFDNRHVNVKNLFDENGNIKGTPFKKDFQNISGSAGAAYAANQNVNLKLNIARAFRAPSIAELSSNGAHEGTIRYEYGDRNLKSEISTQADASLELNNKHVSFTLSGYLNSFDNFIFYRKLSSTAGGDSILNLNGETFSAFTFDQQRAVLSGVEATLDIHPHPVDWLHFQNTFSFVRGRLREETEGSKNLPFIPAPKLLTEVRGDFPKAGKHIHNLYAKAELENNFMQSRAFTAYNTETPTRAYSLLNAGIGADIINRKGVTLFKLNLSGNNLADIAYQSHLSRLKYAAVNPVTGRQGVFNAGRNFSIKVNVPMTFKVKV